MTSEHEYLTVGQLTRYIHRKFTADPYLERVYVTGEISNFRERSRHQYFSLKDKDAVLEVVMYAGAYQKVKFKPEEGMKVLATGRVDVYEKSGRYQLIIDHMEPQGIGALYQAYEQLKAKLKAEGLFDRPKRPIPRFPRRIAVITSQSGAVIKDIMTTVNRRYPIVQLVLFPAAVQGKQAAASLVGRLKEVNARENFDTIIIGRGGGSIEDLWPFNEEEVARAIVASKIPVISSVGHETDTTIADLVADCRVATPTAAAEIATPVLTDEIANIIEMRNRMVRAENKTLHYQTKRVQQLITAPALQHPHRLFEQRGQTLDQLMLRLENCQTTRLKELQRRVMTITTRLQRQSPQTKVAAWKQRAQALAHRLQTDESRLIQTKQHQAGQLVGQLDALSPLKIMTRGYAYVTDAAGQVVRDVTTFEPDDQVCLHMSTGQATARIEQIERNDNGGSKTTNV
ncbi:exodeoxyribonuclease VII large subunit [Ligilactobacillus sp. LYQ139]|uniref:exodeoxyribonuclease VII large subunit n=1 Tax=Ligilactobacillus sp. LYQ139 TaxID=3378800 RepID=UPI0038549D27